MIENKIEIEVKLCALTDCVIIYDEKKGQHDNK